MINNLMAFCKNKKVVLVGNAKSILSKNLGKTIDSFDIVVRFNMGIPNPHNYLHIGKKTNIWSASLPEKQFYKVYNYFKHSNFILSLLGEGLSKNFLPQVPNAIVAEIGSFDRLKKVSNTNRPSTGLATADFLSKMECDMYCVGFDFFKTPTWYWERTDIPHNGDLEKKYILDVLKVKQL